jgi:hypothetical protein
VTESHDPATRTVIENAIVLADPPPDCFALDEQIVETARLLLEDRLRRSEGIV